MPTDGRLRQRAGQIADDVLFPAAAEVDRSCRLPRDLLDRLAAEGFYGVAAPGPDGARASVAELGALVEAFAGGCLSAAFVWIQHHGSVGAVAGSADAELRRRWLEPLATGRVRAGIALGGLRPGPDQVRVTPTDDGWRLTGRVPWVTGWDLVDVVQVAAVGPGEIVHFLLVDVPRPGAGTPSLTVTRPALSAVQASSTVEVALADHRVPPDRLVRTVPLADWVASNASGTPLNGFLALGVAARCARLLGTGAFDADLDRCRTALAGADPASTPAARAEVSRLAHTAAGALAVHTGSRAALAGSDAERLLREAGFLLVFGSRPAIRDELLARLTVEQTASRPRTPWLGTLGR